MWKTVIKLMEGRVSLKLQRKKMDGSFILQIKTVQTPFTWEVCTVENLS